MPVSHIGLTVSHLPTSCSFFLSALQPLGYRFIGQQGNQIGLGIEDADFFLCQETPGVKAGAAHIAFSAPDRIAVRDFYTAALQAGGRPNGAPSCRNQETGDFNAAVLDFDGNSIEVCFRNEPDYREDGTVIEHSRVLTWQKTVSESIRDDRSVASGKTAQSSRTTSKQALVPAAASVLTKAPSVVSKAASMTRSVSAPVSVPQAPTAASVTGDGAAKKIIGTLLGAAAGAAVAYAMVKSEEDSAKKEAAFLAHQQAKSQPPAAEQPKLSVRDPQPIYEAPPKSVHRNISETDSQYSTPLRGFNYAVKAIEAGPPQSYYSPTYVSAAPSQAPVRQAIEYAPASSFTSPRSQLHRSMTSPDYVSTYSKPKSVVPPAPSTLISSFAPEPVERRASEGSVHSHRSSRSKAKSHVSKHTSKSRAPSPPPAVPMLSYPGTIACSILGRGGKEATAETAPPSVAPSKALTNKNLNVLDFTDSDTVAPSDSISNAGSRSSHRSHKSHKSHKSHRSSKDKDDTRSTHSKHSSSSKRSSKHSSHSKRSHHSSHRTSSPLSEEWWDVDEEVVRPDVISEPSDTSTIKPTKSKASSSRKDSVTGRYDNLFSGVQYGAGSVATMPIRGITPSMISDSRSGKKGNRSVASYAMGQ